MKTFFFLMSFLAMAQVAYCQGHISKLLPGPYTVGFKAGVHYDIGRPALNEQFARYNRGRAIHISVWYPARRKANHPPMMVGEYIDEISRMLNPGDITKRTRNAAIAAVYKSIAEFGGDSMVIDRKLGKLMHAETRAYRNAAYQGGDFPIVFYPEAPYLGGTLSEYLASYGYIVVSVARRGTYGVQPESSVRGLETTVQDYQFALNIVRREFDVIKSPLGAIGRGSGATSGMAWMNRNDDVHAFVSLEGDREEHLVRQSPYYDSLRMTKPMLLMGTGGANSTASPAYPFADRYLLTFTVQWPAYCLSLASWQLHFPGLLADGKDVGLAFEWMARYTLYFLDWHLKLGDHGRYFIQNHPESHNMPEGLVTFDYRPAEDLFP
jgi:hypothetical protein